MSGSAWLVLVAPLVFGCAEPLVEDSFTPEQWDTLRASFAVPAYDVCQGVPEPRCTQLAELGRDLFSERALSSDGGHVPELPYHAVSCADCHDAGAYYVDTESTPTTTVSTGALKATGHNALPLVNLAIKDVVAGARPAYGWTGLASTADVVLKLALPKAMASTAGTVREALRDKHWTAYVALFGDRTLVRNIPADAAQDAALLANLAAVFDKYERRLVAVNSRFDQFIGGTESALTPEERHGFQLFATTALCIECHDGPLLTDLEFHVTGIRSENLDHGRNSITGDPADEGAFLTPSLRNVGATGPYMHAGQFELVGDVVDFYRRGGDEDGFLGTRDPRIEPIDMTDADRDDLRDFLLTLTGDEPDCHWGGAGSGSACP